MKIKMAKIKQAEEKKDVKSGCDDKHCPIHGHMSLRGRTFVGTIIKNIYQKTATVEWERRKFVPKYERYEKRRTRVKAHVTPCIEIKRGDTVKIVESRPISKTKKFVIVQKM